MKVGDTVRLKSGGPLMTVKEVNSSGETLASGLLRMEQLGGACSTLTCLRRIPDREEECAMAFIRLIVEKTGARALAGPRAMLNTDYKVMLNTDYIQGVEVDPQMPTITLVKMADGKLLRIVGDYDAVSSQIAAAHKG